MIINLIICHWLQIPSRVSQQARASLSFQTGRPTFCKAPCGFLDPKTNSSHYQKIKTSGQTQLLEVLINEGAVTNRSDIVVEQTWLLVSENSNSHTQKKLSGYFGT